MAKKAELRPSAHLSLHEEVKEEVLRKLLPILDSSEFGSYSSAPTWTILLRTHFDNQFGDGMSDHEWLDFGEATWGVWYRSMEATPLRE